MMLYNPSDWYWGISGQTDIYSSKLGTYVSVNDATYQQWISVGNTPTNIDTEENLGEVLGKAHTKIPTVPAIRNGYENALLHDTGFATMAVLLDHENRIRNLSGEPPLSMEKFNSVARPPPS